MAFPSFWFFGFLNHMGWPWTTGLLRSRKVVSHSVVCSAIQQLARVAIALGALRPKVAISLLADLFSKTNCSRRLTAELWFQLDPSPKVDAQPEKPPEEIIASYPMDVPVPTNQEELQRDLIAWENVLGETFGNYFHLVFTQGLIWGLSHPEEALARHEELREKVLKNLPFLLQCGVKVHPVETLEEFANANEESVNEFQDEVRPLAEVPQDLLDLPVIKARIGESGIRDDVNMEIK
jgi:hypothetical protein